MTLQRTSERMAEALAKARLHWEHTRQHEAAAPAPVPEKPTAWTVAISRDAGVQGAAVAQAVADRLGWTVYDRELLQKIADERGLRVSLLESVDERHSHWLGECLEAFSAGSTVNENAYVRYLTEMLFSLAAMGGCVIVGRGAAQILPAETTLRVRLVAPRADRIEAVRRAEGLAPAEAARWVDSTDKNRFEFVKTHFAKDPRDPLGYDLVINTGRLPHDAVAEVIVHALRQAQAAARAAAAV